MITIKEVAEKAKVSKSTVSRVFNRPELVKKDTRNKVLEAAEELGFTPNPIARSLVTGKSGVVALVIPDIMDPTFSVIARGCSDVLTKHGLTLALYNSDEDQQREEEILGLISERNADGIIIASSTGPPLRSDPSARLIPMVYIQREPNQANVDAVFIDNKQAAKMACEHLLELGHKSIAIVTGLLHTIPGKELLESFSMIMNQAGVKLPEEYIIKGNFKMDSGVSAAQKILSLEKLPTAVFVCSDLTAYSLMETLKEEGVRIPEDISIVGSSDLPMSAFVSPKLTTMHYPIYRQGQAATKLLVERMNNPKRRNRTKVLQTKLVVRESTTRPK